MIERYTRKEIKEIWEDYNRYSIWLNIELAAAEAMEKYKVIPKGVVKKVKLKARINPKRILQIENKVKNKFYVSQNKKKKINVIVRKKNNFLFNQMSIKSNSYFKIKLKSFKNKYNLIFSLLANISSYVGNRYPGKYSIISSININFNNEYLVNQNDLIINSYKLSNRLPLIKNILSYKKFNIEFDTLERPYIKKNKFFIKKNLKKKIKDIKDNILIIGGSSGIGNDILNMLKINNKILKIATFNKNKINLKAKNFISYKVDVFKDFAKIENIVKKHGPVKIFYFPTTKIYFDKRVNEEKLKEYKEIFLNIPRKIIKSYKEQIISLFYPSTINIKEDSKSDYSKVKKLAEISLKKICVKSINFNCNKLPKNLINEAKKLLPKSNYIGFSITQGNKYRKKSWSMYKFISLANKSLIKNKIPVFFIEKNKDHIIEKIKNQVPRALFPETNSELSCPALVTALSARLDQAVSIDNGIMHMMSLADIPMIVLFGPTNSEKFAPKNDYIKIVDSKKIHGTSDIEAITVDEVYELI